MIVQDATGSGMARSVSSRVQTIFLLACMALPLFYLLLDSYEVDFRAFYVAGASAASNLNPYVDNSGSGERFTDPTNQLQSSRWVYPPPGLLFVTPFARLGYTPARLLFGFLSIASTGWVLLYVSGRFRVAEAWIVASYVSIPVLACIERGQIDLLILALLVLSCACGSRFWAGIPLGVAISIKVFPGAIVLWLLLKRRFRQAAVAVGTVAAMVAISAWRYGTAGYSEFRQNLASLAPGQQHFPVANLSHSFDGLAVDGRWLTATHGFIGSYNNPLVLADRYGIAAGVALVLAIALWLHYQRVRYEVGFFAMVLAAQIVNTRLWTMGMVMYLPICIIAIARARSIALKCLLMVPLFLPSQIRPFGVSPRLVLALAIAGYAIHREMQEEARESGEAMPA